MNKLKIAFLYLVCLTACSLFLLEVILRLFTSPSITPGYIRTHPERCYELKSNFQGKTYGHPLIINSYGLRDYERSVSQNGSVYRICIFGDSITFGHGVKLEDTFSKILEKKLNDTYSKSVQVFNCGVPSYNTAFEYLYLKDTLLKFKPHLVIFEFTAGNDTALKTPPGSFAGINRNSFIRWLKDLLRYSYSYHWLARKYYTFRYNMVFKKAAKGELLARLRYDSLMYRDNYQGWIETKQVFSDIVKLCKDNKINLIFAIYANNMLLAKKLEDDPMYPIIEKVISALKYAGVEHIVLLDEAFRIYAGRESILMVNAKDAHFSFLAHNLVAGELYKYIVREGFLKR